MSEVKIAKGYAKTGPGLGRSVESFTDALQVLANCSTCGCEPVLGYWTQIDAATGELMMVFINNGVLQVETYESGLAIVKGLCSARS